MCDKTSFPGMKRNGVPLVSATIYKKDCAHGNCEQCREFARSENCVLSCPSVLNNNQCYRWKEYINHTLDNGYKIKELRPVTKDVDGFTAKFATSLKSYQKHYYTYRWLNLCRKMDVLNLDSRSIYIQTDYSA
jgi:hypothetical protein